MNQPKTSKAEATERPWHVSKIRPTQVCAHGAFIVADLYSESDTLIVESEANAVLIVQAVNEYEALDAVAEAAGSVAMASHNIKTAIERFGEAGGFKEALDDKNKLLLTALSALAALRAKE